VKKIIHAINIANQINLKKVSKTAASAVNSGIRASKGVVCAAVSSVTTSAARRSGSSSDNDNDVPIDVEQEPTEQDSYKMS
jgi:hypothetical protein